MEHEAPAVGDLVFFRDPDPNVGSRGNTGRIAAIRGADYSVEPTAGWDRNRVIPKRCVEGFWPKGSKNMSLAAMRRLQR